jgi:hypothetical protein
MVSIDYDGTVDKYPQSETNSAASAAKRIGGALVAMLILVSLVELPVPAKDARTIPPCHLENE